MNHDCGPAREARLIVLLEDVRTPGRARERLTVRRWHDGVVIVECAEDPDQQDRGEDLLDAFGVTWRERGGPWELVSKRYAKSILHRLVFLDAQYFTERRWRETIAFSRQANATVLILHSGARLPQHASDMLAAVPHLQSTSADQVLALLEPALAPAGASHPLDMIMYPAPLVPEGFPVAPRSAFPRFRADAYRMLDHQPFKALDTQYGYAARAAGAWIRTQPEHVEAAAARAQSETAAHARCRRFPYAWSGQDELEIFLSALVAEVAEPEASVARVRGAQAGFLRHGLHLSVPDHLRDQQGPGLGGQVLDSEACERIAAHLPHPVHAALAALTVLIGAGARDCSDVLLDATCADDARVTYLATSYAVPPAARPLINAARAYHRLERGSHGSDFRLSCTERSCQLTKPCREQISYALAACGLDTVSASTGGRAPTAWQQAPTGPWHAEAACWFVADPLPDLPARTLEAACRGWS